MRRDPASLRYAVTVAVAAVLAVVAPGGDRPGPDGGDDWIVPVGALVAGAALLVLRRRPEAALLVSIAVGAGAQLALGGPTGLVVLVVVSLFLLAVRRPWRVAVGYLAGTGALWLLVELLTGGFDSRVLAPLALMAAATAAGVAVAGQRALVRSVTERAVAAERTRQDDAARQVADERLRIARELHDVVAHHVAVMGIQAGAAEQLLDTDREQVRAALAQVRTSGRTALAELGAVVGLLRTADAVGEEPLQPVATGLARLPELVSSVRAAGLRLTAVRVPDDPGATGLDEVSDIAAYRIVQEALTNALKHGTGEAGLAVVVEASAVTITVENPVGSPAPPGTGHGLPGMHERAGLVGAQLVVGPTGRGFAVQARIPVRRP